MNTKLSTQPELIACARSWNIPISLKHSVEISKLLRYKKINLAKQWLEEVILGQRAVPYTRFKHNVGHRAGMAAGRFPEKAAREFLRLVKSVEANAQVKGLNSSHLKICKIIANRASLPLTGSRFRYSTKRTNLEIEVREQAEKKEQKTTAMAEAKA